MPDGTIITNVPEGITQAELLRRTGQLSGSNTVQADSNLPSLDQAPLEKQGFQGNEIERSAADILGRTFGLAGRDVLEGLSGIAGIVTNPISLGVNTVSNALGGPDLATEDFRGSVSSALTEAGVPAPETRGEQAVSNINQFVVGGGGTIGLGRAVATQTAGAVSRAVGSNLAANPALQGTSAVSAGTAGEAAEELGASPGVKLAAQLAGGIVPGVATVGAQAGTRRAIRGGEAGRQRVEQNIDTFGRAGTSPTVGQATEGRIARATESLLSRTPGSAGKIISKATTQADEVGVRVQQRADELARKATPERAGRAIEKGITGK